MAERCAFDLVIDDERDETLMRITSTPDHMDAAANAEPTLMKDLSEAVGLDAVRFSYATRDPLHIRDDQIQLDFVFSKIWEKQSPSARNKAYQAVMRTFFGFASKVDDFLAVPEANAPLLVMLPRSITPGTYQSMQIRVAIPEVDEASIEKFASLQMQRVAQGIRLSAKIFDKRVLRRVRAQVAYSHGVALRADVQSPRSHAMIAGERKPDQGYVDLSENGPHSNEQRLVCLAGAIAIAKAGSTRSL